MKIFAFCQFRFLDLRFGSGIFPLAGAENFEKGNQRSRACTVLESTNPNPSTNGYSRVVSWIDDETLGIVHAEAYDVQDKLLKEFYPKYFKKVNGQWEVARDGNGQRPDRLALAAGI